MNHHHIIIVGQGIAGTLLSFELIKAGKSVLVIDNGHKTSASKIAAGMWNPILFKRLKKSWRADDLLPQLKKTYSELEVLLGVQFMFDREIVRLFPSNDSANDFHLKVSDELYSDYLEDKSQPQVEQVANDLYGYGTVHGGYVDLEILLTSYRKYLLEQNALVESNFNEDDLKITEDGVLWKNYRVEKIIYANGYKTIDSKYWSYLPLSRTHGNLLHVDIDDLDLQGVFNNGQWLLNREDGSYKMGATFEWDLLDPTPSKEAKEKLITKLESGLSKKPNLQLKAHEAGIRPTTSDHRPLLGLHPENNSIGIFNGMGTKGVMLAPYFARQFANYIVHGTPVEDVVNINRFPFKKDH